MSQLVMRSQQQPLKVWLITIGEPLPIDGAGDRLLRTGILAERFRRQGHEVVWWSSGFDHIRKRHRDPRSGPIDVEPGYQIQLLESSGYRTNVSFKRMYDHRQLATDFRQKASSCETPDVILCSWPTLELCDEAVSFGRSRNIPVILDVRDMWPDVLVNVFPNFVRPLARAVASPLYRMSRRACQGATAVTAITDGCINWARQLTGMTRQDRDRAFPLAYREKSPTANEQNEAIDFWKQRGIVPNGQFVACFFGTFGRQFELDTIFDAATILHRNHVPIRFVLCGAGPDLERCQKKVRDLPNVLLPGWVNAAQIWTLMRMSAVGLAPYHSTFDFRMSIPNKTIEYMSAGLPIVSSLQGTLAELLQQHQAGLTYHNNDPEHLADSLNRLYSDSTTRENISKNARTLYRQRFVAETVYDDMVEYLCSFAARKSHRKAA